jgi:hypothetical protein
VQRACALFDECVSRASSGFGFRSNARRGSAFLSSSAEQRSNSFQNSQSRRILVLLFAQFPTRTPLPLD